ncbi:MAG: hypothetical protein J5496_02975 [Lachnospiraceae bacterium]|nr:hypothetical protein [Lachnospiraceae bacterium]
MASSRKKAKNSVPVIVVLAVVAALLLIAVLTENRPSLRKVDLSEFFHAEDGLMAVVRDNVLTQEEFLAENGIVYTSVSYLQEKLNKRFYFDKTEKRLLYTKPEGTAEADQSTLFGGKAVLLQRGETTYVLLDYVRQFMALDWTLYEEPLHLVLKTVFGEEGELRAKERATVRAQASVTSPILVTLELGEKVHYLEEQAEWDYICTIDGIPGYVLKKEVSDPTIITTRSDFKEPVYQTRQEGTTVGLAWQQVGYRSDNDKLEELIAGTRGLSVISPTWLFLSGSEGKIVSLADSSYVARAHAAGLKVWVLLNNMNYEIYGDELCSNFDITTNRRHLISSVMDVVVECGADGINVDIESLPAAGGRGFLQFIRELSVACHTTGLTLSVDNYVPSRWTEYYNRAEQAVFADYIVVMGYDEHYAGSDPGSTASLPFVIKGVEDTLTMVPARQIIWAVPFFTRLWRGSGSQLSSAALRMSEIPSYLEKYQLSPTWDLNLGQYYVEFKIDQDPVRIWIEDTESMALRLDSITPYGLAGVAAWRLGMEGSDIWPVIDEYIQNNQIH